MKTKDNPNKNKDKDKKIIPREVKSFPAIEINNPWKRAQGKGKKKEKR